jgi:hypothetical protein
LPRNQQIDRSILEAALVGLEHQRNNIDGQIALISGQLGVRRGSPGASTSISGPVASPVTTKRKMSPAARKRIGEATRKRWEAFRNAKGQGRLGKTGAKTKTAKKSSSK